MTGQPAGGQFAGGQPIGLGLACGVVLVAAWIADGPVGPVIAVAGGAMGWLLARATRRAAPEAAIALAPPVAAPPPPELVLSKVAPPPPGSAEGLAIQSLRHDLRGILSPALLIADRLQAHADPSVQRAGSVVTRTVERAAARLEETKKPEPTATQVAGT